MAEEHADERPPSLRLSQSPFESDPTALPFSTSGPSTLTFDMDIGARDPSLPPLNFNIGPPRPTQASARHSSRQGQPHPYQPTHTFASTGLSAPLASSNLRRPESHSSYHQEEPNMQMHAVEVAHDNTRSSHGSPAQHAGAPAGTHLPNPELSPVENEGSLFDSYDRARAERDRLFRKPLVIVGDDVEEVDQHDGRYVLAIVKALKHKDFLPPPETKKAKKKNADGTKVKKTAAELIVDLSDSDKANWLKWQQDSQTIVEGHLDQPKRKADTLFHYQAWEVVSEVIKIHRQGFLFTNKKTNEKLKCSARIEEAIRVIEGYARVRVKLLEGDKISNFCISPQAYAKVTVDAFWNNSGRAKPLAKDAMPSQRMANRNGALAGRYGEDKKSKKKRKPAETKGDDAVGAGSGVEQESTSAVLSQDRTSDLSPVDEEEGEEDEDAELESDDDATAEQAGNDGVPIHNNGGLGDIRFGYVPDHPSLRRFPHNENTYEANFSDNMNATTMYSFHPPIQVEPPGSRTSGAFTQAVQHYPMPVPSAPMSSTSSFEPSMTTSAGYPQRNMYPLTGFPTGPRPVVGYPESTIDSTTTARAGLPNTQGTQSDAPKTRPSKRRKP